MTGLPAASLCTGYGGLDLAAAAGFGVTLDQLWHAEIDPAACKILGNEIANVGNIVTADWSRWPCPYLLTMGPPCQPVSRSGVGLGVDDPRWLWPACTRALAALRPALVLFENVRGLLSHDGGRTWAGILVDLEALGYAVRWTVVGACTVGAPHHRHRVFLLARHVGDHAPIAVRVPTVECGAPRSGRLLLLPSPLARDARSEAGGSYLARRAEQGRSVRREPLGRVVTRFLPDDGWGPYAPAVERWERLHGPAPAPTEPDGRGGVRLAPELPEWMMGLAPGFLTGVVGRSDVCRLTGNGVHPLQGAAAVRILLTP
jgi:DNA (cytosine-5)-methyltransferase 1